MVGIVASRLIDTYYRPTIVLTKSGDYVAGSARSVAGFNLYEAIHACREWLLGYGGHFAAAGMTLLPEHVGSFAAAFENAVAKQITPEQETPEILIDAVIHFSDVKPAFFHILQQMEPFGPDNMRPIFLSRKVKLTILVCVLLTNINNTKKDFDFYYKNKSIEVYNFETMYGR